MGVAANNRSPLFLMASTLPVWNDTQGFTGTLQFVSESTTSGTATAVGWFKVVDLTALRELPTLATNSGAIVDDINGYGAGWYRWDNDSSDADDDWAIIAPADGGAGRWKRI
jgi:hypothetical protein